MTSYLKNIEHFEKFGSILGLERIGLLLDKMNNPQKELSFIHIAGTNGKGSTSRFIYEVLRKSGYRVGIYTSPFLEVFNERIEVCGEYISDNELNELSQTVTNIAKKMEKENLPVPTEFDIVTAMAFEYFKRQQVDVVILEVGLGGRADSTNIIDKTILSSITNISFDHTDRLGSKLEDIAYEKAGIIKKNGRVIVGKADDIVKQVILDVADDKGAIVEFCKEVKEDDIIKVDLSGSKFKVDVKLGKDEYKDLEVEISMIGRHQVENCNLAVHIISQISDQFDKIDKQSFLTGLKEAKNKGRFEIFNFLDREVVLDGAHNEAGMTTFYNSFEELFDNKSTSIICGFLIDKDVDTMVKSLCNLVKSNKNVDIIVTEPQNDRKIEKAKLVEKFEKHNVEVKGYFDTSQIKIELEKLIEKKERLVFVGSLYLIGDIRKVMGEYNDEEKGITLL